MTLFHGLLVLSFCLITINSFRYEVEFRDERLYVPCEESPEMPVDNAFDLSNITFQSFDDGSLYVFGTLQFVYDLKADTDLQFVVETYKKSRDNWVYTVYNVKRSDFCRAAFEPTEVWHMFIKSIPIEQRTCPFYKGQRFDINTTSKAKLTLPDPRADGDYVIRQTLSIMNGVPNTIACSNIFITVYRV